MKSFSILSAAVMLAASVVSASNDPRECEGEERKLVIGGVAMKRYAWPT